MSSYRYQNRDHKVATDKNVDSFFFEQNKCVVDAFITQTPEVIPTLLSLGP